jgi:hypothetical protein
MILILLLFKLLYLLKSFHIAIFDELYYNFNELICYYYTSYDCNDFEFFMKIMNLDWYYYVSFNGRKWRIILNFQVDKNS